MLTLPEYPWESLAPYRRTAQAHPGGISDLSIGTPVDPTPQLIQDALTAGADAHGYPTTHGTPALREAISGWFARRRSVPGLDPEAIIREIHRRSEQAGPTTGPPRLNDAALDGSADEER